MTTSPAIIAPLLLLLTLAPVLAMAADAQESYVYVAEYGVYTREGVPLGAGRIVYPLGGQPAPVYVAGTPVDPRSVAALIDTIVEGRYDPVEPVPNLKPLFPVVAYNVEDSTLPAICSLEETPVTGVETMTLGGGAARGNAWIAPGTGVPVAGSLVGETRGGALFRVDFYLSQAPDVVCGVEGSPLAASLIGVASGVILLGGVGVLGSRLLRGNLARL